MTWRPVVGYEALYEVSDTGLVRRISGGKGAVAGRVLTLSVNSKGYLRARLHDGHGCRRRFVHRLVAEAFLGLAEPGQQCNHIDGDKTNNRASNLEWLTARENMRHAFDTGLKAVSKGAAHPCARLSDQDVAEIRALAGTETMVATAARFGVSAVHVLRIQRGEARAG